ncbi:preprotein translocase subunit SecE [Aestuariibacter sp. GS-14]|uniref:preprotein translocase subunit SecE n=1 Tax=Aestuariibacter sp. GS-14 TaxID=2590670 RepID=UPI00112B64A3|nr:preprotein translocase subunit SecE [Aestuariibacter sp. GS-14]TPV54499.1 preprotein translocase subunit SecE [Aestuariibacter sp. GS-14]
MSEKTENSSNSMDMLKWLIVFALLAGVITTNYVYGEVSILYRAIGALVGVAVAGFIAATTMKGVAFLTFAKEARLEVRKVVWPTRQELNQTTLIVLGATFVASLLLWGIDGVLVWLVSLVTGIGA